MRNSDLKMSANFLRLMVRNSKIVWESLRFKATGESRPTFWIPQPILNYYMGRQLQRLRTTDLEHSSNPKFNFTNWKFFLK